MRLGLLRVCAFEQAAPMFGISDLRVLLVSDLLARAAALQGLQVLTAWSGPIRPVPRRDGISTPRRSVASRVRRT